MRRLAVVAAVTAGAALATVPTALAAGPAVSPEGPSLLTPVSVSWRATATGSYAVTLTIRPTSSNMGRACSWGSSTHPRRVARGALLRVKLRQAGEGAALTHKWCPGRARVTITRFPPDYKPGTVIAKRTFRITRARGETEPPPADTPATIRVLPGSTISVSSPGDPDRVAPVRGVLRGSIPSPFRLGDEITIARADGALAADGLAPDPRCPAVATPSTLPTQAEMRLPPSGPVRLGLIFGGPTTTCGASEFTGWGFRSGTTAIILSGTIGPPGLLGLRLNGSADGIALALKVQVDLSGRP